MMEAARTSETLVNFYQTTRCYNPEDSNLRPLPCSHDPTNGPCPELVESSPHPHTFLFKINYNIILLSTPTPYGLLRSGFPTKILYALVISPMRTTDSVQPILLDLVALVIFGEK
jgi:hypothetical protein